MIHINTMMIYWPSSQIPQHDEVIFDLDCAESVVQGKEHILTMKSSTTPVSHHVDGVATSC